MNAMKSRIALVVIALLIPTWASAREEAPIAVYTEGLPEPLRLRLEEKAREGPTALIRYLQRTRHIYNLRFEEIVSTRGSPALREQRNAGRGQGRA